MRIVVHADDVSQAVIDAARKKQSEQYLAEIGVDEGPLANAFDLMLGLAFMKQQFV